MRIIIIVYGQKRKLQNPGSWNFEQRQIDIASKPRKTTTPALASTEGTRILSLLWAVEAWQDIPCHPCLRVLCAPYGFNVRHL
jgi:hypothetical protein